MKNTTRYLSMTLALVLLGFGSQAFAQQYIAEKIFKESQQTVHQETAKTKQEMDRQKYCEQRQIKDDQASASTRPADLGVRTLVPAATQDSLI